MACNVLTPTPPQAARIEEEFNCYYLALPQIGFSDLQTGFFSP
jgi:hypothetical protein